MCRWINESDWFAELRYGEVRRIPLPRTPVNKDIRKGLVLRASSKRTVLVSDRAPSHARALRGSLAPAYASCSKEEG
jgi:hypothetical protein